MYVEVFMRQNRKALDGHIGSTKGHNSRLIVGSRRGTKHPRDMVFHTSDSWSPYKSKDAQPKDDMEKVKVRDMELWGWAHKWSTPQAEAGRNDKGKSCCEKTIGMDSYDV